LAYTGVVELSRYRVAGTTAIAEVGDRMLKILEATLVCVVKTPVIVEDCRLGVTVESVPVVDPPLSPLPLPPPQPAR
jgi:hypothetical protein